MQINHCEQCGGFQIIGPDGVGRDVNNVVTPMLHQAARGMDSDPEDMISHHLDCLPVKLREHHMEAHGPAIEAAEKGTRGDELVKILHTKAHNGFDADDHEQYQAWVKAVRAAGEKQAAEGKKRGSGSTAASATVGLLMTLFFVVWELLASLRATLLSASLDPALGNPLLDVLLNNAATGTVTLGTVTLTAPYNCRFQSTRGVAGTNGTNITGTNSTGINGLFTTAAASAANVPTKSNTGAISITATASGTWNGIETWDTSATPKRVQFGPTADLAKAFASGDILSIPTGSATGTVQ